MKKFIFFFLILNASLLLGDGGGSIYTRYGLGDRIIGYDGIRGAMGGLGGALIDGSYLGSYNPASLSGFRQTRIQANASYFGINYSDNTNSSFRSNFQFSGFSLGFPISEVYSSNFVIGIIPYSNVQYELESYNSDFEASEKFEGAGGINKIYGTFTYKIPLDFLIGASFEYYFGKIEYLSQYDFDETTFTDPIYIREQVYLASGFNFGIISPDLSVLLEVPLISELRISANYNKIGDATIDTSLIFSSNIGADKVYEGVMESPMPSNFGIGMQLELNEKFVFISDYFFEDYNQTTYPGTSNYLEKFEKFSFGFEYKNSEKQFGDFSESLKFRVGFSYEKMPFSINDNEINSYIFSGGISLPFGFSNSIDLGFSYIKRGGSENNLLQENIYLFNTSVSLGEIWFRRPERL